MSAEVDAMLALVWEAVEMVPEGEREYVGGRLIQMAQALLGPVYWPITLKAPVTVDDWRPGEA
jgi:hypothetical protein